MIHEIEQILDAERDATLRIKAAHKEAVNLIQKAREEAKIEYKNRKEDAEREVQKIHQKNLWHTQSFSTDINKKTQLEVEELVAKGELHLPAAVDLIVKRITGGSDVLSGTDG
jgi:vacuolar-type H+-ATPase subunit H